MKFKLKKYIYLLNDITALLLKKEREHAVEDTKKLREVLIVVSIILVLSLALNAYFILVV